MTRLEYEREPDDIDIINDIYDEEDDRLYDDDYDDLTEYQ